MQLPPMELPPMELPPMDLPAGMATHENTDYVPFQALQRMQMPKSKLQSLNVGMESLWRQAEQKLAPPVARSVADILMNRKPRRSRVNMPGSLNSLADARSFVTRRAMGSVIMSAANDQSLAFLQQVEMRHQEMQREHDQKYEEALWKPSRKSSIFRRVAAVTKDDASWAKHQIHVPAPKKKKLQIWERFAANRAEILASSKKAPALNPKEAAKSAREAKLMAAQGKVWQNSIPPLLSAQAALPASPTSNGRASMYMGGNQARTSHAASPEASMLAGELGACMVVRRASMVPVASYADDSCWDEEDGAEYGVSHRCAYDSGPRNRPSFGAGVLKRRSRVSLARGPLRSGLVHEPHTAGKGVQFAFGEAGAAAGVNDRAHGLAAEGEGVDGGEGGEWMPEWQRRVADEGLQKSGSGTEESMDFMSALLGQLNHAPSDAPTSEDDQQLSPRPQVGVLKGAVLARADGGAGCTADPACSASDAGAAASNRSESYDGSSQHSTDLPSNSCTSTAATVEALPNSRPGSSRVVGAHVQLTGDGILSPRPPSVSDLSTPAAAFQRHLYAGSGRPGSQGGGSGPASPNATAVELSTLGQSQQLHQLPQAGDAPPCPSNSAVHTSPRLPTAPTAPTAPGFGGDFSSARLTSQGSHSSSHCTEAHHRSGSSDHSSSDGHAHSGNDAIDNTSEACHLQPASSDSVPIGFSVLSAVDRNRLMTNRGASRSNSGNSSVDTLAQRTLEPGATPSQTAAARALQQGHLADRSAHSSPDLSSQRLASHLSMKVAGGSSKVMRGGSNNSTTSGPTSQQSLLLPDLPARGSVDGSLSWHHQPPKVLQTVTRQQHGSTSSGQHPLHVPYAQASHRLGGSPGNSPSSSVDMSSCTGSGWTLGAAGSLVAGRAGGGLVVAEQTPRRGHNPTPPAQQHLPVMGSLGSMRR